MATLHQYVIYNHPLDDPENYVVRRWEIGPGRITPGEVIHRGPEVGPARLAILDALPGAVSIGRSPDDDPKILEVWL